MNSLKASLNGFYFIVLSYYVVTLTLPTAYNSIAIISLFALFLFSFKTLKANLEIYYSDRSNLLLLTIFTTLAISLLYSEDKSTGLKGTLSALPLVIIPLSLTAFTSISEKQILFLKKLFVWCCLATSLIYLFLAIRRSGLFDGSYKVAHLPENHYAHFVSQLTYNHLSPSIHPIFYSLYIALAVLIVLFYFKKDSLRSKILQAALILYFLTYMVMLTSITINFALYSFLALFFYWKFSFKRTWHYFIFFGTILAGAATTAYLVTMKYIGPYGDGTYRFDSAEVNNKLLVVLVIALAVGLTAVLVKIFVSKKIVYIIPASLGIAVAASIFYLQVVKTGDLRKNNISARLKYGNAAISAIKKHPIAGIGIGDKKNTWIMKTEDLPPGAAPGHVFNSHNQFLDLWVAAGIIPTLCFVLFLVREFKKALRTRNLLYTGLLYCFSLFCFTDSAMLAQRGHVLLLLFTWFLGLEVKRNEEKRVANEQVLMKTN